MELVKAIDLSCARGGVPVLSGVNFALDSGQALILRGPNGSGKTTLLRTLAGLQPPVAGRLESGAEAIAYAAHADGLKGALTVRENLIFWAGMFGADNIASAVQAFDIDGLLDRPAANLSAGQKRRVGLARLVLTGRPVWALDEPTVSLDVDGVAQFARAIQRHLATGGAAIIATHIDLGLEAETLDISRFKPRHSAQGAFDEAFL